MNRVAASSVGAGKHPCVHYYLLPRPANTKNNALYSKHLSVESLNNYKTKLSLQSWTCVPLTWTTPVR